MPQRVEGSIEVEAPVREVYEYWSDLENLAVFMANVEDVTTTGDGRSHWKIKGPFGQSVEFDARTTRDEPEEAIAWNSEDGDVQTSGQVLFREAGPGKTRVDVTMNYADPPGGQVGEVASRVIANPRLLMEQDLRNFKDIMEGNATPEEVQQRPSAATAQSGALAFLTSGTGLLVLGGGLLLFLLLRRGNPGGRASGNRPRIILEL